MTEEKSAELTRLLTYLRSTRGFDFTGYKMSSLTRRLKKRMSDLKIQTYAEYTDYLEAHPDEFGPLFDTVLINVTSFFRDPEAWDYLAGDVIPRILADKPDGSLRIWVAGCASGQEAYTMAILFAEALGEEAFKARVKIYTTDADEEALTEARQASYEERETADLSAERLGRFFTRVGGRYVFRADLRRSLIFGRHDLVQDAAISQIDLLSCRNTLMYFNIETQHRILARFHFALARSGFLFLGKAETLLAHSESFRPVDLRRRIFQRSPSSNVRDRLLAISPHRDPPGWPVRELRLRDAAFDSAPLAQLVVDRRGNLTFANHQARLLFGLSASHLGRPLQDLEVSYKPVDLRSALDRVYDTLTPVTIDDIAWQGEAGKAVQLELRVAATVDERGGLLGASICFTDMTAAKALKRDLERANQELETAYEELQSTNEELETTNEELQSTIEELETTNEELQSANEELETMNEELMSTNEELRTMNDQLHQRSVELNQVNGLLEWTFAALKLGIVVLDATLAVHFWSHQVEDLWGLRAEEVRGKPFLKLDIGIPLKALHQPILDCLAGAADRQPTFLVDGVNRRGKPIRCQVSCRTADAEGGSGRVLLVMQAAPRDGNAPPIPGGGEAAATGEGET